MGDRLRGFEVSIAVLALSAASACAPASNSNRDIRVQNRNGAPSQLIFACDRPTNELAALFTPALIADLQQLKAGVALSTEDLSPERARVIQALNSAGIPMTAWLALPRDQGYYINAGNPRETTARFEEFDRWSTANHLRWQAVGLDIEPSLSEYGALMGHKGRLLSLMLHRAFNSGRVNRARQDYAALIREMQARGYYVETYQLLVIADERRAHTTVLERLFGIVDVHGNEEVLMLYTSFNHAMGAGMIWQYGPESQAIAVGSTAASGDPAMDAKFPALNWDEFSRDLIVARHFSDTVGVYSLEGCVKQGFLAKLKAMNWGQPVVIPASSANKAVHFRHFIFGVLWIASHVLCFIVAFLLGVAWLTRAVVRRRRRKRLSAEKTAVA